MLHLRSWLAFLLLALLGSGYGTAAQAASTAWVGDSRAAVRLVTEGDSLPQGRLVQAGIEFRFAPGWHGYWRTPGDAGLPPFMDWSKSDDVETATVSWPAPSRLIVEGLQNSVYTGQFVLPVALHLKEPGGPADIKVSIGYAACSKICVPYSADLALKISGGTSGRSAEAPLIDAALALVPGTPGQSGIEVTENRISKVGDRVGLVVGLRSATKPFIKPDLFVEGAGEGLPPPPEVVLTENGRVARLNVPITAGAASRALTLTLTDGDRAAEFSVGPSPPASQIAPPGWIAVLVSALLGGAILNLMPCVLPVLSIKLFALTRHAGEGRRAIRLGFLATAFGNIASFGLLAAVLVGLKWSGASLGWGIQFQQPLFLAAMATATVLFAASFFEWLPIRLPNFLGALGGTRAHGPLVEAFLTGVLATLLATPCSAPFVGTAVGFALAQGPVEIVAVFLCLGIGMALPYWAVALFPGLVRWLPRPGAWMLVLRKLLGLVMLGTTVWLLFVLWSTAGALPAAGCGILLAALLFYRAWLHFRPDTDTTSSGTMATFGFVAAALTMVMLPWSATSATPDAGWRPFDQAAVPLLVAQGKTVLVDVTATWCLTCKVNDLVAFERAEVKNRLAEAGVVRMRADWSRPDTAISNYLRGFSRYGIPLDVVYGPRQPGGEALPELLTPVVVIDAINRATAISTAASTPAR